MGKRQAVVSQDDITRALNAVRKAGIEIRTIRIERDGSIIINGDRANVTEKELEKSVKGYL